MHFRQLANVPKSHRSSSLQNDPSSCETMPSFPGKLGIVSQNDGSFCKLLQQGCGHVCELPEVHSFWVLRPKLLGACIAGTLKHRRTHPEAPQGGSPRGRGLHLVARRGLRPPPVARYSAATLRQVNRCYLPSCVQVRSLMCRSTNPHGTMCLTAWNEVPNRGTGCPPRDRSPLGKEPPGKGAPWGGAPGAEPLGRCPPGVAPWRKEEGEGEEVPSTFAALRIMASSMRARSATGRCVSPAPSPSRAAVAAAFAAAIGALFAPPSARPRIAPVRRGAGAVDGLRPRILLPRAAAGGPLLAGPSRPDMVMLRVELCTNRSYQLLPKECKIRYDAPQRFFAAPQPGQIPCRTCRRVSLASLLRLAPLQGAVGAARSKKMQFPHALLCSALLCSVMFCSVLGGAMMWCELFVLPRRGFPPWLAPYGAHKMIFVVRPVAYFSSHGCVKRGFCWQVVAIVHRGWGGYYFLLGIREPHPRPQLRRQARQRARHCARAVWTSRRGSRTAAGLRVRNRPPTAGRVRARRCIRCRVTSPTAILATSDGRNGSGRGPDADRTIGFKETGAGRTQTGRGRGRFSLERRQRQRVRVREVPRGLRADPTGGLARRAGLPELHVPEPVAGALPLHRDRRRAHCGA
eukprot:gene16001-biopygen8213